MKVTPVAPRLAGIRHVDKEHGKPWGVCQPKARRALVLWEVHLPSVGVLKLTRLSWHGYAWGMIRLLCFRSPACRDIEPGRGHGGGLLAEEMAWWGEEEEDEDEEKTFSLPGLTWFSSY
jgi:hypothetical protein